MPVLAIAQSFSKTNQHEHIVVTGTRTAKLLSNSPVLVDVIDGDMIAKISHGTLAQALNYLPGVVIKRSVKDGYNIQMQGFDGDHVLVLIDGQPIISPTGSSADLDQIPAENIEQIELIRGASSVMYGSSAMGGVINIITRKSDISALKFSYDLSLYQGNTIEEDDFNHTVKVYANENIYGWRTQLNALLIDDQGFDYNNKTIAQNAASVDKNFITLSTSKDHSNIATSIKYQWLDEKKLRDSAKIPNQNGLIFYQTDLTKHQFNIGLNSTKNPLAPWKFNVTHIHHQEVSGQSNSIRDITIELSEANGQKVFQLNNIELVTGGVIHVDKLHQFKPVDQVIEVDNKNRSSVEMFVQGNWTKNNNQLLAGIRGQYDSDFGWHNAMRLSAMKKINVGTFALQWRTGIGQSYRVPNLKERFYRFDHSALGYQVLGNSSLSPETADSINTSVNFNTPLFDNAADLQSNISIHYAKTKQLIDTVIDDKQSTPELTIHQYTNISEATIHGVDLSAELKLTHWQFQFNYSYLTSKDNNNNRLFSRPRHQIKFNVNYDINAYDIELIAYAVYQADEAVTKQHNGTKKDVENNAYATFNILMNQSITNNLSWRFSVDNIFDEHQNTSINNETTFDARPVSSRTISAGINYQF